MTKQAGAVLSMRLSPIIISKNGPNFVDVQPGINILKNFLKLSLVEILMYYKLPAISLYSLLTGRI